MLQEVGLQVEVAVQFGNIGQDESPINPEVWTQYFQTWLTALQPSVSPIGAYELSLRLTDDVEIQALNDQYRHRNQPTDVLAFAAMEVEQPQLDTFYKNQPVYLGDIVISVETAQKQTQQGLMKELAWLAAHGLLHLLGWDHPDEEHLNAMLMQQEKLLGLVGLES